MSRDAADGGSVQGDGPTRREYISLGGAVVGSGLLAGCLIGDDGADGDGTDSGADGSGGDGPYSVTMSPAGTVEFQRPPENVMVYSLLYADMAVTYGAGDAVNSLGFDAETGGNTLDAYYERLDGVSFDRSDLEQLNTGSGSLTVDEELFYELDSDLHLVDPCLVASFDGWSHSDVDEIGETIAPWFGNVYSRSHGQPPEGCREDYQYYTLWEIAETVADVFRQRERYEALAEVTRICSPRSKRVVRRRRSGPPSAPSSSWTEPSTPPGATSRASRTPTPDRWARPTRSRATT